MYHTFFIHSSVSVHLGCSNVLAIVNSAAYLFELWFSQGLYPGVGLLGLMEVFMGDDFDHCLLYITGLHL